MKWIDYNNGHAICDTENGRYRVRNWVAIFFKKANQKKYSFLGYTLNYFRCVELQELKWKQKNCQN